MYPRGDINKLNRRREAQQRIEFAHRRLLETVIELQLVRGKIASLPKELERPPEWALDAARLAAERWLAPIAKLTPEAIRDDPRGAFSEIMGIFDAMVAFAAKLPEELPREDQTPEERKFIGALVRKSVIKRFLAHFKRIERVLGNKLPMPTHAELVEHARRYEKGLTEVFSPEGDVVGARTLTAQIYHGIWFFWPKLAQRESLRALDVQKFFAAETGHHFGIKLIEAVYADVGLAEARIKPRKTAT